MVPALASAPRGAHQRRRARTRLSVDDPLAVELGHREAEAFEHLRAGAVRARAARGSGAWSRAFWFSVVQLYIFWALPCALLRSPEGFARSAPVRAAQASTAGGPGAEPVIVQLYHARKEVRHNLGHQHCGAGARVNHTEERLAGAQRGSHRRR